MHGLAQGRIRSTRVATKVILLGVWILLSSVYMFFTNEMGGRKAYIKTPGGQTRCRWHEGLDLK